MGKRDGQSVAGFAVADKQRLGTEAEGVSRGCRPLLRRGHRPLQLDGRLERVPTIVVELEVEKKSSTRTCYGNHDFRQLREWQQSFS
jgi:hypothetical protein